MSSEDSIVTRAWMSTFIGTTRPISSESSASWTKSNAHELLNAVRAGMPAPTQAITAALWLTGDLNGNGGTQ
jgi:hypothetical protein